MEFFTHRIASIKYGFFLPLSAGKLILNNKALLFWSAIPVLITIAIYSYIITYVSNTADGMLQAWFTQWEWDPSGWKAVILDFIVGIVTFIIAAVSFAFVGGMIASPFNDVLAEKTEALANPPLAPVQSKGFTDQFRLIMIDIGKAAAATFVTLMALLFAIVPIVNLFIFTIAFLLICFQFTSYPQTRRGVGVKDGLKFLWRHLWACTGFGMAITFLFALPLVSSLALPLAVVGGTLLVARAQGGPGLFKLR